MQRGLALRRASAHPWLLIATAITCAGLAFFLCGLSATVAASADDEAAAAVVAAPARTAAWQVAVDVRDSDEVAAVDAFAEEAGAQGFEVTESVRSAPVAAGRHHVIAASWPDLAELAHVEAGRWGGDDDEVTVSSAAARRLGVEVGDVLTLGGGKREARVEVVGVWAPDDATDARWFADPLIASGTDAGAVAASASGQPTEPALGPVAATPALLERVSARRAGVRVLTAGQHLDRTEVAARAAAVPALIAAADEADVALEGGLADRLVDVARAQASIGAVTSIALALVALVGGLALWQVAGALRASRAREQQIVRARGAGTAQLLGRYGADAVLAGGLGLFAGVVLAAWRVGSFAVAPALLAVIVAVGVLVVRVWPPPVIRTRGHVGNPLVTASFLVGIGAAVSVARLLWAGDAVVSAGSGARTDVLVVLAPTLVLLACGLLAVACVGPVTGASARLAARASRALPVVLALRHAARRPAAMAAAVTLVALAAGAVIASAAAGESSSVLVGRTHAAAMGADVRVDLDARPLVDPQNPQTDLTPYEDLPAVDSVRPAIMAEVRVADVRTTLLAAEEEGSEGGGAAGQGPDGVVRVTVTEALSEDLDLAAGDRIDVAIPSATLSIPAVVGSVSPLVRGLPGDHGMLADRSALLEALSTADVEPATTTLLIASDEPERAAAQALAITARPASVQRAGDGHLAAQASPTRTAWRWTGVGAALLGATGLLAVLVAAARQRRREAAVLRALGVRRRDRRRARLVETVVALATGTLAGLVGAGLVLILVVRGLADALVPGGSPAVTFSVRLEAGLLLGGLGVLLVSVVAAALISDATGDRDDVDLSREGGA